jgi:acyl phosphate:glycerol-3-phosphate acyltransferase
MYSGALMSPVITLILTLVAAYLIGSVPFAVIVSKLMGLQDPRTFGSGNPGATNVLRSGSKLAALLTLVGDAGKGAVAVLVAKALVTASGITGQSFAGYSLALWVIGGAALGAFFGHVYSFVLKFKGGKGVATAAGVLLALDWRMGLAVLAGWIAIAAITRYSSLAALVSAAVAAAVAVYLWELQPVSYAVIVMSVFLIIRHHENIKKLLNGTESKLGAKKT